MDKVELTEIELKLQKIINDADQAYEKNKYPGENKMYWKEYLRCEFLKIHLKSALGLIEHMERIRKVDDKFHKSVQEINALQNES